MKWKYLKWCNTTYNSASCFNVIGNRNMLNNKCGNISLLSRKYIPLIKEIYPPYQGNISPYQGNIPPYQEYISPLSRKYIPLSRKYIPLIKEIYPPYQGNTVYPLIKSKHLKIPVSQSYRGVCDTGESLMTTRSQQPLLNTFAQAFIGAV